MLGCGVPLEIPRSKEPAATALDRIPHFSEGCPGSWKPGRVSRRARRTSRQGMQISTVNSPSTLAKGPLVVPQNEQCPASSVTGAAPRWPVVAGGRCSRRGPDHRRRAAGVARAASGSRPWSRRPEHRAQHVGGRPLDGGEVDAEQLGALLQWGGDRVVQGRVPGRHARWRKRTSVRTTVG